jgi:hypothetical protein
MPRGRPTKYTPELADEICRRIASGETLVSICQDEHMPNKDTIRQWRIDDRGDFSVRYARAREDSAASFEERALGYCDVLERGGINMADVTGLKEAAQILKWAASVRAPKTHGDLTKHQHTGADGAPLQVVVEMPKDGAEDGG